jgi:stress response protein YsnF
LRKYVVIEEEQVTVPVRREKVVLETEAGDARHDDGGVSSVQPLAGRTAADAAVSPDAEDDAHADAETGEMILHEERPVVTTETVPVERVRLGTVEETVEQQVSAPVRKERVALEEDVPPGTAG